MPLTGVTALMTLYRWDLQMGVCARANSQQLLAQLQRRFCLQVAIIWTARYRVLQRGAPACSVLLTVFVVTASRQRLAEVLIFRLHEKGALYWLSRWFSA